MLFVAMCMRNSCFFCNNVNISRVCVYERIAGRNPLGSPIRENESIPAHRRFQEFSDPEN